MHYIKTDGLKVCYYNLINDDDITLKTQEVKMDQKLR